MYCTCTELRALVFPAKEYTLMVGADLAVDCVAITDLTPVQIDWLNPAGEVVTTDLDRYI